MMDANIKRHAYADYTGQSYMNQHGVPLQTVNQKMPNKSMVGRCACMNHKNQADNRTIIRTNQPNTQQTQNIIRTNQPNTQQTQNIIDDKGAWAQSVRKDNLYRMYVSNC